MTTLSTEVPDQHLETSEAAAPMSVLSPFEPQLEFSYSTHLIILALILGSPPHASPFTMRVELKA